MVLFWKLVGINGSERYLGNNWKCLYSLWYKMVYAVWKETIEAYMATDKKGGREGEREREEWRERVEEREIKELERHLRG